MQLSMSSPRELLYCKGIGGDRWGFDSWNVSNLPRQAGLLHVKSLTMSINIPRLLGPQLNYWSRESALERAWLCLVFIRVRCTRMRTIAHQNPHPLGGVFRLSRTQPPHPYGKVRLVTIDAFLGPTLQFGLCNFRNWAPKVRLALLNFGCR